MISHLTSRTSQGFILVCTGLALLSGCSLFREPTAHDPRTLEAESMAAGLPQNLPADFPLPPQRDTERTFNLLQHNDLVFSAAATTKELTEYYGENLAKAGYRIQANRSDTDGSATISFVKNNRLGNLRILPAPPARFSTDLDLRGTTVEILYDLAPPPAPSFAPAISASPRP